MFLQISQAARQHYFPNYRITGYMPAFYLLMPSQRGYALSIFTLNKQEGGKSWRNNRKISVFVLRLYHPNVPIKTKHIPKSDTFRSCLEHALFFYYPGIEV